MLFLNHKTFYDSLPISLVLYAFDKQNNNLPFFATELPSDKNRLSAFHEHNHDDPEFIFVTEGHLFAKINDVEFEFSSGDMLCISPYNIHSGYVYANERTEYICVQVSLSYISNIAAPVSNTFSDIIYGKLKFPIKISSTNANSNILKECMTAILMSKKCEDTQRELKSLSAVLKMLSVIIGDIGLEPNTAPAKDMLFVSKVTDYVELNYMKQISTNDIAKHLGYKPSYFCTLFKKNFDEQFVSFLNRYRINKAIMLMSISDAKFSSIAKDVGFVDYKYFNRCFKKYIGITPTSRNKSSISEQSQ